MTHLEEQRAAIEAAQRGERVAGKHSLHAEEVPDPHCQHRWRTLFCNNVTDVLECAMCGKQELADCDFDEEYA
jgi:hypothetical protein